MNKALLEYEMAKKGIAIKEMCCKLGISRSAFYRKCNGISDFTVPEVQCIVDLLALESPVPIFLKQAPPAVESSCVITEREELCKAIGYMRAACENLNNLYLMAKQRGDSEEEMYYYSRFLVIDQNLWSLVNH